MGQSVIAKLGLLIGADTKQFDTALQRSNRQLATFGKKAQKMGKSLSVGITAPLALMGAASIKAFDEQAKAIAQVDQGLKSTGGAVGRTSKELQKLARDLQKSTLFGDEEILKGATSQLLTFTNITGDQFERTQKAALDLATRLDGDLKSASIQLGKALNDPVANLTALSRSGIQFSASQKETIKTLTQSGKLMEAQNIILTELEQQYGGSAEAAVVGAGKLKQLSNVMGDFGEEIGGVIFGMLEPFIDKLTSIAASFSEISPSAKKFIVIAGGIAAAIGPILFGVGKFIALIPVLKAGFATMLGPVGLVILAVAALGTAFVVMASKASAAEQAQQAVHDVGIKAAKAVANEKVQLEQLISIAKDDTKSRESRLKAVKKLNAISPEYLGNLTLENIATAEGTSAIKEYTKALEQRAKVQAAQERLVEIEKELLDVQEQFRNSNGGDTWDTITNAIGQTTGGLLGMVDTTNSLVGEMAGLNAQKEALLGILIEEETALNANTNSLEKNKTALAGVKKEAEQLKALQGISIEVEARPSAERGFSTEYFQSELDKVPEPQLKIGVSPIAHTLIQEFSAIETAWAQMTGRMEGEWTARTMKIKEKTSQIASDAGQLLGGISSILAQGHSNAMDNLNMHHERELEAIKKSGDAGAKKEARIAALNARTEKKRRELTIKRAKHEKAVAVMNAIINTASAVAQALPNYILAGAVAALGAAQVALIAGTPVPALAKGGLAFGPTLAMVGDNPGASSNPEVIAPLDKLKSMMGGGAQSVVVSVKDIILDGAQLRMVLDASDRLNANTY